jgi:hypothetical protein
MEPLLDVLFLFDSVPLDLYPACAEEMYSDYDKSMLYSMFSFCMDFWYCSDRGLHVVAHLGLPLRCRESGFHSGKTGSFY